MRERERDGDGDRGRRRGTERERETTAKQQNERGGDRQRYRIPTLTERLMAIQRCTKADTDNHRVK